MESFRFAWWNTRLARKDDPRQREVACEVVQRLIDRDSVALLALGEVKEHHAEALRRACRSESLDLLAGESLPRDLALLYRRDIVRFGDYERLRSSWIDKELAHCFHAWFHVGGMASDLDIFVLHWPSDYLNNAAAEERRRLAQDLRSTIRSKRCSGNVLILGDFNAEPFDRVLRGELETSRERERVRIEKALFYNPFWRLLGEQQSLQKAELAGDGRKGAGTYFYRGSNHTTQWYTMDQFLVSASLLDPADWHLWEDEIAIWQEAPLIHPRTGRPRYDFDHFPILGALLRTTQSGHEEGR